MKTSNRPTHYAPLTDAEKAFPRGAEAGQKSWQGGPRFVLAARSGAYKARTGNSNGIKKNRKKGGPKMPPGWVRPVWMPSWAKKYLPEVTGA
jgi:hypothetical protein